MWMWIQCYYVDVDTVDVDTRAVMSPFTQGRRQQIIAALKELPEKIRQVLQLDAKVLKVAEVSWKGTLETLWWLLKTIWRPLCQWL